MNTVIKTLCLILSLCAAFVYAGEQIGENQGSGSPRSSLNRLMGVQVESLDSLGTVDPEDLGSNAVAALYRLDPNDARYLPRSVRDGIRVDIDYIYPAIGETKRKSPQVVFGATPFAPTHTVQKKSCLQKLACLWCCCK